MEVLEWFLLTSFASIISCQYVSYNSDSDTLHVNIVCPRITCNLVIEIEYLDHTKGTYTMVLTDGQHEGVYSSVYASCVTVNGVNSCWRNTLAYSCMNATGLHFITCFIDNIIEASTVIEGILIAYTFYAYYDMIYKAIVALLTMIWKIWTFIFIKNIVLRFMGGVKIDTSVENITTVKPNIDAV